MKQTNDATIHSSPPCPPKGKKLMIPNAPIKKKKKDNKEMVTTINNSSSESNETIKNDGCCRKLIFENFENL